MIGPFAAVAIERGAPRRRARGAARVAAPLDDARLQGRLRTAGPRPARRRRRPRDRPRDALAVLRGVAADALASGEADVVSLPPLELGSPELAAFESLGGPLDTATADRALDPAAPRPPGRFDDFLASRSSNTRRRIRRDARQLDAAFGDRLQVEVVRDPAGVDRLIEGGERVASSTYQRKLGAGLCGYARAAGARASRPRARLGPRLPALARRDRDRILALLGVRGHDPPPDRRATTPRSPRTASGSSCSCA